MQALFYAGAAGIALFSLLKFIGNVPLPGTDFESLNIAYFAHRHDWALLAGFSLLAAAGVVQAFRGRRKWLAAAVAGVALAIAVLSHWSEPEDVFEEPEKLVFKPRGENQLDASQLVVGVEHNGEAKAYPLWLLAMHHQVRDVVGGKAIIITYCPLCRTARVFEPVVDGRKTTFLLVGLNHFNSVYEDAATRSWWQQATGKAVAGPLKGQVLPELETVQLTVEKWFELRPNGLVMQTDPRSGEHYPSNAEIALFNRNPPWDGADDSWVVGVEVDGVSKAYDWNLLLRERIVNDTIGRRPVVLAVARDHQSFAVFERPTSNESFSLRDDLLYGRGDSYDFAGRNLRSARPLTGVKASQEYWRCRRVFYPQTMRWERGPQG